MLDALLRSYVLVVRGSLRTSNAGRSWPRLLEDHYPRAVSFPTKSRRNDNLAPRRGPRQAKRIAEGSIAR